MSLFSVVALVRCSVTLLYGRLFYGRKSPAYIVAVRDAHHAHMYRLDRADLEWILDADDPSESFPTLKNNELKEFGEYRTQRYALDAYDRIARGELPDIPDSE